MELTMVRQQRGTKVLVDGTHLKTVPLKFETFVKNHFDNLNLQKKRLDEEERSIFNAALEFEKYKEKISKSEPLLYVLIEKTYPVDAREVITRDSRRFELVLDNNLKVKCPEKIYLLFATKPNVIHSNY
ncbi:hypothetical protein ACM55F_10130 [Flavobacterium sp. XS2P12]|uniref:hypothetical protein n=1 Tax=Flavobacterium melibiosi TaxID=3398734 RepID=UPI003A8C2FB1